MISLGDLARSYGAFGAQTAATPASLAKPLPPATVPAPVVEVSPTSERVSISAEGVSRLQHATKQEEQATALRQAVSEDPDLAARTAHDHAYRYEVIALPSSAYTDLATSRYTNAASPAMSAANLVKARSELDQARLERIALYETEVAKGTPPAKIFDSLAQLDASRQRTLQHALAR